MKPYFLDTNVVLNFLTRREPFAAAALEIFRAGLENRATLYVASLSFSTVYYVLRKQTNSQLARTLVANLEQLVTVIAADAAVIQQAIAGPFADFEDGLQHDAAAAIPAIEIIVTRNATDFTSGTVPALTPDRALLHLSQP